MHERCFALLTLIGTCFIFTACAAAEKKTSIQNEPTISLSTDSVPQRTLTALTPPTRSVPVSTPHMPAPLDAFVTSIKFPKAIEVPKTTLVRVKLEIPEEHIVQQLFGDETPIIKDVFGALLYTDERGKGVSFDGESASISHFEAGDAKKLSITAQERKRIIEEYTREMFPNINILSESTSFESAYQTGQNEYEISYHFSHLWNNIPIVPKQNGEMYYIRIAAKGISHAYLSSWGKFSALGGMEADTAQPITPREAATVLHQHLVDIDADMNHLDGLTCRLVFSDAIDRQRFSPAWEFTKGTDAIFVVDAYNRSAATVAYTDHPCLDSPLPPTPSHTPKPTGTATAR